MVDVSREAAPLPALMSSKKKQLLSAAMKRTSEWIFSQEIPSDITVQVGGATFSLHKFPLVSKCGCIRKLVSEASDSDLSLIDLPDVPGGAEAFELAAKFCYGINFEINTENVATLRCTAEHLEMTEDYAPGNLVTRTEDYLNEAALASLPGAIAVLRRAQSLLPMSEKVNLVGRCVDAIACMASDEAQYNLGTESSQRSTGSTASQPKAVVEWWAEELAVLRVDVFKKVLMAMKARGFKEYALGPLLMLYAQKSLRGLDIFGRGRRRMEAKKEHEKRVVLETVVGLLPRERHAMSVSFLTVLLRAAIYLETTVACRLDLERRISLQLGQAVLDDLLIPSFSFAGDTVFDVDTVQRILVNYLECDAEASGRLAHGADDGGSYMSSPSPRAPLGDVELVEGLMEGYLAEIASDPNLSVSRFVGFAELIPEQSRSTEDGMYRAVDIYLKAHPSLSDMERKKVCGVMDCQKLSREACAHAAQNSRLPVQVVVQVLYYEQQRLREATGPSAGDASPALSHRGTHQRLDCPGAPGDELTRLRRENEGLKLELVRMRMQLREMQKPPAAHGIPSAEKPPLPKKSIMNSVSKKLGKLNPFLRADAVNPSANKVRTKPPKDRRHSIS